MYSPGCSDGIVKKPWVLAIVTRAAPLDSEVAVTLAPLRTAPLESVTTPAMVPTGACAIAGDEASAIADRATEAMRSFDGLKSRIAPICSTATSSTAVLYL
jgi:hypothetical protein